MNPSRQLRNASGNHAVQVCLTEYSQVDVVTRYIKDSLLAEEGIFVIARRRLGKILRLKMNGLGFDE